MVKDFMAELKKITDQLEDNVSVTENGAIGYKTSGQKLVDLNFMLSSMRNMGESEIWGRFLEAYNENPLLALLWLFFARDVRGGCGERRTFRIIFERLCTENDAAAKKLIPLIPFYGRWDDVIAVYCGNVPCDVRDTALEVIRNQFYQDLDNERVGKPISLLAKWMPSEVTSSKETVRNASRIRCALGYTPRTYRKTLSRLRKHIDVTEQKMSANEWGEIGYEAVPSRAAMNYRAAFARHDAERYEEYLTNVKSGKAKINAGVLYPYDIVHAYGDEYRLGAVDDTLEEQWKALPNKVPDNGSTLVVVDGSGSMGATIGNTKVTCHDVANSLGIYFAEKLKGPYHNSFITFSSRPQFVYFNDGLTLRSKLRILYNHDDCSNTDIEKTFDLILDVAVKNHLNQSDIPANILIVSDMEFDAATWRGGYWYNFNSGKVNQTLFDGIRKRWEAAGYKLPRLVFWNVCSRTGTIPVTTNDLGVALVSGFSPNIADMVMSANLDPYDVLVEKLTSARYNPVREALKE